MHRVIQDGLEDFLTGGAGRNFQAHLDQCAECRSEIAEFQDFSSLLHGFREPEPVQPSPSFYLRVAEAVEAQRKPSFWNLFSVDSVFGRRLVFASLMTLTLMGGILISQEMDDAPSGPDAIIASHDFSSPHDSGADRDHMRDHMMVTLASYDH